MGQLTPYIISEDARSQSEFYVQALGGEILTLMTHEQLMGAQHVSKDKVMHMSMVIAGGNPIFMADAFEEPLTYGSGITLSIAYKTESEADEAFAKLAAGGNVKHSIKQQPFGMYFGELSDKYGVRWTITAEPRTNE